MASSTLISVNDITEKLRTHRIASLEESDGRAVRTEQLQDLVVRRSPAIAAVCKIRHRSEPLSATDVSDCRCQCSCSNIHHHRSSRVSAHCSPGATAAVFDRSSRSAAALPPPMRNREQADVWLVSQTAADSVALSCPPCKKPCRLSGSGAYADFAATERGSFSSYGGGGGIAPSSPSPSLAAAVHQCPVLPAHVPVQHLQKPVALRPIAKQLQQQPADATCGSAAAARGPRHSRCCNLPSSPPPLSLGVDAVSLGSIFSATSPLCGGRDRTSPESPLLLRPLSVSSGFYDGSGSSLSGCSVSELSGVGGGGGAGSTDGGLPSLGSLSSSSSAAPSVAMAPLSQRPSHSAGSGERRATFGGRCSSMDEQAACGSTRGGGGPVVSKVHGVVGCASIGSPVSFTSAVSLPSVAASGSVTSAPSSPRRQRPPRCRSQPCDLQRERRFSGGGMKRRHEDERPSLDFDKMTETAYDFTRARASSCGRPRSSPMSMRCHCRHTDVRLSTLQTIASSPLDASTVLGTGCARRSPVASCGSPPMSPPARPSAVASSINHYGGALRRSESDLFTEPFHLVDDENEQSDREGDPGDEADVSSAEQFPIDLNGELDLEQIEQD